MAVVGSGSCQSMTAPADVGGYLPCSRWEPSWAVSMSEIYEGLIIVSAPVGMELGGCLALASLPFGFVKVDPTFHNRVPV